MPTYVLSCRDGDNNVLDVIQVVKPMSEAPRSIVKDGRCYIRDVQLEGVSIGYSSKGWPMESLSLGVNPNQIPEAMRVAKEGGMPIEFNQKTGAAILTDPSHRASYAAFRGCHDNDGGYLEDRAAKKFKGKYDGKAAS